MKASDQRITANWEHAAHSVATARSQLRNIGLGDLGDLGPAVLGPIGVTLDLDQLLAGCGGQLGGIRLGVGQPALHAFLDQLPGLVEKRLDHLGLGHDPHHLALYEQMASPPAGGDADVGLPRLTRGR